MAPRDGSGVYSKPPGTTAVPNTTIASAPYNALQDDMADALTESLPRTGVAPMLADLPMNGKKITNLDDGTDPGDAVNRGQLDGKQVAEDTTVKTSAYTVTTADNQSTILCGATSAAFTVTLPAAATAGDGFVVTIKKTDPSTNAVTIEGSGSELIDGASTFTVSLLGQAVTLICDGSNWRIKSNDVLAALGVGQTWQNMTASRLLNTNYVNNTGRPIVVAVTIGSGSASTLDLKVGGVTTTIPAGNGDHRMTVSAVVPSGTIYNAVRTGSTALSHWAELR